MTWLLPLAVILPLAGAGVTLVASRRPRVQRVISVGVLATQLLVELTMLLQVTANGTLVMHVGGWTAPFGITLVADELAAFMLVVSSIVALTVLVYAISQGMADESETPDTPVSVFHPTFLIAGHRRQQCVPGRRPVQPLRRLRDPADGELCADHPRRDRERLRAGATYVVVSLLSSLVFLTAIAMIYAATGTVNLADLSVKLPQVRAGHRRDAAGPAAGGVRGQGRGVPDVRLAARLLSQRTRTGDRGVRRPAHQGRHLRDHPGADAAVPARLVRHTADDRGAGSPCWSAFSARSPSPGSNGSSPSPWSRTSGTCCSASRWRRRPVWARRSTTWRTTSWCRPRCSWARA